jgi:hypothetical protein
MGTFACFTRLRAASKSSTSIDSPGVGAPQPPSAAKLARTIIFSCEPQGHDPAEIHEDVKPEHVLVKRLARRGSDVAMSATIRLTFIALPVSHPPSRTRAHRRIEARLDLLDGELFD